MLIEYIRENNETKYVYKMFNIFKVENIEQKIIINIPINQFSRTRKVKKNAEISVTKSPISNTNTLFIQRR